MLQAQVWERHLLRLAHEALESGSEAIFEHHVPDEAYQLCAEITRENSKTFFMASSLLPDGKREAARALYAFCRVSDDLVDRPDTGGYDGRGSALEAWRHEAAAPYSVEMTIPRTGLAAGSNRPHTVALAWADARRAYRIPQGYADQLIDGLALDLNRTRYETFADLARYCYGVACTVGLMSMHIVGYAGREAIPYAIRLGVALQLTNILRDVGEDWRAGRLYLPLEELRAFGLSEDDIAAGVEAGAPISDRWRAFMRFQVERARTLYEEALPGVAMLHPDGRFAIAAAGELYRAILNKIEENDYDVFTKRASVGAWGKLRRLPGIWWRSKRARV